MRTIILILFMCFTSLTTAASLNYSCVYPTYTDRAGVKQSDGEDSPFSFEIIQYSNDKAIMKGNLSMTPLLVIKGNGQVSFVEVTQTKNVMVTTITDSLESVHSRNLVMFGKFVTSQYFGSCKLI